MKNGPLTKNSAELCNISNMQPNILTGLTLLLNYMLTCKFQPSQTVWLRYIKPKFVYIIYISTRPPFLIT